MERITLSSARIVGGVAELWSGGSWVPVPDAVLMAEGVADSEGKMLVGEDYAVYIVDTQPSTQLLIDLVTELADAVSSLTTVPVSKTPDLTPLSPAGTVSVELVIAKLNALELI